MVTTVGTESEFNDLVTNLILLEHDAIAAYESTAERLSNSALSSQIENFRHDHDIRLPRAGARRDAKAFGVIARHRGVHHLDRTTGQPECHPMQAAGARPIDDVLGRGQQEPLVLQVAVQGCGGGVGVGTCGIGA